MKGLIRLFKDDISAEGFSRTEKCCYGVLYPMLLIVTILIVSVLELC